MPRTTKQRLGSAGLILISALVQAGAAFAVASSKSFIVYPKTETQNQVDDYHGVKVTDPYRWLEDANSAKTKEWVEQENKVTFAYLDSIPVRNQIKERLTKLWDFEKFGIPAKFGAQYFFEKNSGLQNQNVLYTTKNVSGPATVLLDPNTLSTDGTVALSGTAISDDGKLLAYGLASAGSDWQEWHVRDVNTGKDLSDIVKWVKFSGASWTKDNKGFFYSRYDEPKSDTALQDTNYFQKLYYHKLGQNQSEDKLIYERKDQKEWQFEGEVTEDGRYLIITITKGTDPKTRIYYKDLNNEQNPIVQLLDKLDAKYTFVGNNGQTFWFLSDLNAPRGRVIAINTTKPAAIQELIPQSAATLDEVNVVGNRLFANYMKDAHSDVKIFSLSGKQVGQVEFATLGTAHGFGGKRSYKETFYSFEGFATPATIYRYDIATNKGSILFQPKLTFNPADYESKQVFYTSKDGTKVPMFITFKKGIVLNGTNPTYLYGYGGFDISITPFFIPSNLAWMEMGGIYAVPNLRGGGEYGEEWHQAGMKVKKQNVFDDFISAAEWLIANKYTSKEKLAIGGGSNGGLLVGAAITQRPELYAAALPAVGVMDMLRFHKYTIGWAWAEEYGSSDDADLFKAIYAYSPLHNIKPGTSYPATLITTADHDDRVVPAHSFKFAATLQAAQAGPAPILIRIETKAGHGFGKPTSKKIEEASDKWAFLWQNLEMPKPTF